MISLLFMALFWSIGCDNQEQSIPPKTPKKLTSQKHFVDHVQWIGSIEEGFKQAKATGKNLIIMVDSEGCRWCIKIEQETFNDPQVLKKFDNYIMVKVSREDPQSRAKLPEFVHVPIMFFYQANGELIDDLRGYYTVEDFLGYLQELEDYLE